MPLPIRINPYKVGGGRPILIRDTTQALNFYQFNPEHAQGGHPVFGLGVDPDLWNMVCDVQYKRGDWTSIDCQRQPW